MTTSESWAQAMLGPPGPFNTRFAHRPLDNRSFALAQRRDHRALRRYAHDRSCLLESDQFLRLSGITQVFFEGARSTTTRLTHSLEVAVIAARIAAALGLSADLTEAIAIGHDCGHTPFGHVGEILTQSHFPRFSHALWGADHVLSQLRLTSDTLDGIRNHPWSRPSPSTPEGEVVSWADRIGYLTRDYADAVQEGLVSSRSLPLDVQKRLGGTIDEQREALINSIVSASRRTGLVSMQAEDAVALALFREHNFAHIYRHAAVASQAKRLAVALMAAFSSTAGPPTLKDLTPVLAMTDREVLERSGFDSSHMQLTRFIPCSRRHAVGDPAIRDAPEQLEHASTGDRIT